MQVLFPTWLCNEPSAGHAMILLVQLLLGEGVCGKTSWNSISTSHCCIHFTVKMRYWVRNDVVRLNETVNEHPTQSHTWLWTHEADPQSVEGPFQ